MNILQLFSNNFLKLVSLYVLLISIACTDNITEFENSLIYTPVTIERGEIGFFGMYDGEMITLKFKGYSEELSCPVLSYLNKIVVWVPKIHIEKLQFKTIYLSFIIVSECNNSITIQLLK